MICFRHVIYNVYLSQRPCIFLSFFFETGCRWSSRTKRRQRSKRRQRACRSCRSIWYRRNHWLGCKLLLTFANIYENFFHSLNSRILYNLLFHSYFCTRPRILPLNILITEYALIFPIVKFRNCRMPDFLLLSLTLN